MCLLPGNTLFLGSRLGDSLLIQYNEVQVENGQMDIVSQRFFRVSKIYQDGRPEKRAKMDGVGDVDSVGLDGSFTFHSHFFLTFS